MMRYFHIGPFVLYIEFYRKDEVLYYCKDCDVVMNPLLHSSHDKSHSIRKYRFKGRS